MLEWISDTLNSMGYTGVFLLMLIPLVSSDVVMPLVGYMTIQGKFSFVGVIAVGIAGGVLGTLPFYYLGNLMNERRLKIWADKYGKWLMVSVEDIENAKNWFDRHGDKAVLFCRLVPGVRLAISIPAGMAEMNLAVFLIYTTLGISIWVILITYLGLLLGENHTLIGQYMGYAEYVVFVIIAVASIYWVVKRTKRAV